MTAEDDLQAIQKRISELERSRAEAKVRLEQETQELRALLSELKEKFGVNSVAEANQVFESLKQDFEAAYAEAEAALKEAGA